MTVIGTGNTGSVLASMFDINAILFSTAEQDTNNFSKEMNVISFSMSGASKRFMTGVDIWKENFDKLSDSLSSIRNDKVIIFSALGGGSGSSSLQPISKILVNNGCKVLIIGVLPFKKENNPPLANAVQCVNSLLPLIDKVSLMIFDNEKLIKEFDSNWRNLNLYIVKRVDYIINLLRKYNSESYSPVTLDQSELDSVIFGGGFVDFSDSFIEDELPKFEYGILDKETKNCLMAMVVDDSIENTKEIDKYHTYLTNVMNKYGSRIPNSRLIPGIIRAKVKKTNSSNPSITDRCYFTIASGLSIDKYMKKIEKIRDKAIEKAMAFSSREKTGKILDNKSNKILDI